MTNNPLKNIRIEYHILQSFPVTCLNRDDVGAPKTAVVGGITRARVSSQAWKRPVRMAMHDFGVKLAIRSKHVADYIAKACAKLGASDEQAQTCGDVIAASLSKNTLHFFTETEAQAYAAFAQEQGFDSDKIKDKDIQKLSKKTFNPAIDGLDIALFGRMVAQATELNVEAAASFAHAISTHKVSNEVEFFTALDDLKTEALVETVLRTWGRNRRSCLQRGDQSAFRTERRDFRRGFRQDDGGQFAQPFPALRRCAAAYGRTRRRIDHYHFLDRRVSRPRQIGRLRTFESRRTAACPQHRGRMGRAKHQGQLHCAGPCPHRFRQGALERCRKLSSNAPAYAAWPHRRARRYRGCRRLPGCGGWPLPDRPDDHHRWGTFDRLGMGLLERRTFILNQSGALKSF